MRANLARRPCGASRDASPTPSSRASWWIRRCLRAAQLDKEEPSIGLFTLVCVEGEFCEVCRHSLLRRSDSAIGVSADAPAPSSETRGPPTPRLALSVIPSDVALGTLLLSPRSQGCPQATVRLARLLRVLVPSPRCGSRGCTNTSSCPPSLKGRCLRCTHCYERQNAYRANFVLTEISDVRFAWGYATHIARYLADRPTSGYRGSLASPPMW